MIFKARYKTDSATEYQLLSTHLIEAAMFVDLFARKIGLHKPALLTALVHDLGKNCKAWADYLEKSHKTGKRNTKEDHGTAGGQYLYRIISHNNNPANELIAQLLAAVIMYHHGTGLPDVIKPDGTAQLHCRLVKSPEETHVDEAVANLDVAIKQRIEAIAVDTDFVTETLKKLNSLTNSGIEETRFFFLGLTARFLSSCLIDGDRRSSALFDKGIPVKEEDAVVKPDWKLLRGRLEARLAEFSTEGKLNGIRGDVSGRCAEFGAREDGIYTLTAATGAGKTLASLRYALARAEATGKDHIFIIAPYTSILDQNADVIRSILDPGGRNGQTILEHHSNLGEGEKGEHFIDSSETWNVPIVITTMVQFLEVLFGGGTRKIRRMHQLANSVIISDEVQTLPISCTYLFSWAIQYLRQNANVSILLCTATQPGLDKLKAEYAIPLSDDTEIIPDVARHFEDLKRVELVDKTKPNGWTLDEAANFIEEINEKSILCVANIKSQARKLFESLSVKHPDWHIIHLSAGMCPAHRKKIIGDLKERLKNKTEKCVCISTRLIEAGVDIDFDGAIRFLAGFDSIIQTAGRCNRNGELKDCNGNLINGKTMIVNIVKDEEKISSLPELMQGQKIMERILNQFHDDEEKYNFDLMHPYLIADYFRYYYMEMPDSLLKYKIPGRDDTILDMLSSNSRSIAEYKLIARDEKTMPLTKLRQSFERAWKEFRVIAQDTIGVIVPYENGKNIIGELFGKPDMERCVELLREAQQYSVNVYFSDINYMLNKKIITEAPIDGMEIYTVEDRYYDEKMGLTHDEGKMTLCNA